MIVVDGPGPGPTVLYSATDLTAAARCEFNLVRRLDAKLGRVETPPDPDDPMLERAARLGDRHEERVLEQYRERFGPFRPAEGRGVAEIDRPERAFPDGLVTAKAESLAALRAGADVVFQAAFFDGRFLGYADFLVRVGESEAGAPRYAVYDTKLARRAKVTALLQVAAYADQLVRSGIPVEEQVHLLLGDGSTSSHALRDILPVYLDRRERLEVLLDSRLDDEAVQWGDPRYTACGRCEVCQPEVELHRDLLLVAGMRPSQRERLRAAGITTIDELAASTGAVPALAASTLESLRDQARMQAAPPAGLPRSGGLVYRVYDAAPLGALPEPDEGDIFFDFEGDPLYTEGDGHDWGLDYLFGLVEHDPLLPGGTVFRPFWAHDHAEEKRALVAFLDHVTARLRRHPGLHVYHYANYERAHLQSLCARHGVGEEQLDELLRRGVLVDLYPLVKKSIRVGSPSYGLKKLEPLYMGERYRDSEVTTGADSITAYVHYAELREAGRTDPAAAAEAEVHLREIADYNEYDCVSTLGLRDWLRDRAAENGVHPDPPVAVPQPSDDEEAAPPTRSEVEAAFEPSALHRALVAWIDHLPAAGGAPDSPVDGESPAGGGRSADQTALALAAAAIDYHRREEKSFWWEHYNRLDQPVEEWAESRDVLIVSAARVDDDWSSDGARRAERRLVRLRGELAPGSRLEAGASRRFVVYDPPHPWPSPRSRASERVAHDRTLITDVTVAADGATVYHLEEALPLGGERYRAIPLAVVPARPPMTAPLQAAITSWGRALATALPAFPADAAVDLLRRRPPRRRDGLGPEPVGADGMAAAIRDTLLALDDSYLAVQGPPGTGKTYTGARVIAELVRDHGWTVGVVGQSHAVVENMLAAVVRAGLDAGSVAKVDEHEGTVYTALPKRPNGLGRFLHEAAEAGRGVVVGGTAWDFTNVGRVPRRRLDLLVIDEAGQYSLANTIAVSVAARNLLLLGDPQQLPQVSQGVHPEAVDSSALGWLSDGHDVLPANLGYFLDLSWRMHPAVCAPVSELSYEGALHSKLPETTDRSLEGVSPGLSVHPVVHHGDATSSVAEAEVVVEIVRGVLGRLWHEGDGVGGDGVGGDRGVDGSGGNGGGGVGGGARPLGLDDVIVVAPYNAQVETVRAALAAAGLEGVPVGTVDKFQGREAVVAIVTLAASSAAEVPRGMEFLLMKNRLNVAISRAKWAAHLVYSPALADHLPYDARELATLSAFLRLSREAPSGPAPSG